MKYHRIRMISILNARTKSAVPVLASMDVRSVLVLLVLVAAITANNALTNSACLTTATITANEVVPVNRTYVFGINLALNATSAESMQYLADQHSALMGYQTWQDWWNNLPVAQRTTKWGEIVSVELYVTQFSNYEYGSWQVQALCDVYDQMAKNSSIDFLFAPIDWEGVTVRNYSYYVSGVPMMVSSGDSSENFYQIPGSFGSPTANTMTLTSWLPYLRVSQAKTIAILSVTDNIYQNQLCEGVEANAPLSDLTVVYSNYSMPFNWWTLGKIDGNPVNTAIWTAALENIRALKPDAVVICDYTYGGEFALRHMRETNWMPKSVALSPLYKSFNDPSLLNYVIVPAQYHKNAKSTTQTYFTDSAGYDALIYQRYGVPANSIMAQATLAGMLWTAMLTNAPTNSTDSFINTMGRLQLNSFMGKTTFDVENRQTLLSLVTQILNASTITNIIGPAQAAAAPLIYPMPTWQERIFNPKWGSAVEKVATAFMVLGAVISIAWLIFLFYYWKHPVVYAASPLFCVTIVVGSMLVYGSVFTWMPNLVNDSTCAMRAWLLPLGFMTMFGALLSKTNRVVRLYYQKGVKIIKIDNFDVTIVILVITVVQASLSILAVTVPRLKATKVVVDPYRISHNYWACSFDRGMKVIFGLNVAYGAGLLGWGIYLAYKVRKVPLALYDESKIIGFSIYNTGIFAAIAVAIQLAVGNSNRNVTFMITAICCFLGAAVTTCFLFGAKVKAIYWPSQSSSSSTRHTSSGSGNRYTPHSQRTPHSGTTNSSSNEEQLTSVKSPGKTSASPKTSPNTSPTTAPKSDLKLKISRQTKRISHLEDQIIRLDKYILKLTHLLDVHHISHVDGESAGTGLVQTITPPPDPVDV